MRVDRRHLIALSMRALVCGFIVPMSPALLAAQAAPGAITIGRTDTLWSATLKEKRPYLVYTPPSYRDTIYTPGKYPVLYLLDGDAHFHSVTGLLQILGTGVNGTYVIPEMIVVAIPNTNRMRDLSPTRSQSDPDGKPMPGTAMTGGMPAFLRFIQTELIPHIDSTYRTAPYRVFVGHSLGGITTIDALYTMPSTFNAYVAIDPSLWWDKRVLLNKAKDFFTGPKPPDRTLYVALANTLNADDSLPNTHFNSIMQFNRIAEEYNRGSLRYGFHYYANDDHGSVPMIAEYDALRFIFDGYWMPIQKALARPAFVTEHFEGVSAKFGYRVPPSESMLDLLGTVETGRDTTKALELRRMTTDAYPASGRAWASLGTLLLAHRDTSSAVVAFEKSVALRPTNAATRETLRKLKGGK